MQPEKYDKKWKLAAGKAVVKATEAARMHTERNEEERQVVEARAVVESTDATRICAVESKEIEPLQETKIYRLKMTMYIH